MNPYKPPKSRPKHKPPMIDLLDLCFVLIVLLVTPLIFFLFVGTFLEMIDQWR